MDYIQAVNHVIEETNEYRKPPFLAFIDYEKAVNSVQAVAMLNAIQQQSVGEMYSRI